MSMRDTIGTGVAMGERARRLAAATVLAAAVAAGSPAVSTGAFGDGFGVSPVNEPGYQDSPVFDGDRAFWAGACDRSRAPAIDEDLAPSGGVGSRPPTVPAPAGPQPQVQVQVQAPTTAEHCMDFGAVTPLSTVDVWNVPPAWRFGPEARAGAHADGSATFWFAKDGADVDGSVDNIYVDLPPGFVGDPNAVPKCTAEQFAVRPLRCPPRTQVGVVRLYLRGVPLIGSNYDGSMSHEEIVPVYNLEPRRGNVAELGIAYLAGNSGAQGFGFVTARIVAKARTNGDFGVTSFVGQIPAALPLIGQAITIWGVPWESANDIWRAPLGLSDGGGASGEPPHPCRARPGANSADTLPWSGLSEDCKVSYQPSWGQIRPFVSLETDCNQSPVTRLSIDSYQNQGAFTVEGDPVESDPNWKRYQSVSPAVEACESLDFEPDIDFSPTTNAADGASGLNVDLRIPQKTAPPFPRPALLAPPSIVDAYVAAATDYWKSDAGRATAHLKDTVVTLPAGVSVNPSGARGLVACPDAVVGVRQDGNPPLFNNVDPTDGIGVDCPAGSRIGTAIVETHLLEEPLTGDVVLGQPRSTDPQSGEMLRMFLILRDKERGLVAKIYGSAKADPVTGQITSTFANNPEVPFERLRLSFKGGPTGLLAMPPRCGSPAWSTAFTPWSAVGAATPVAASTDGGSFGVAANCGFGFSPAMNAGMDRQAARASGTFAFHLSRPEGQQWMSGLTAKLPEGLLASVREVPLCTGGQAAAGACPAGSRIGTVDAAAGSGDPFVLEQKGELFLTEGYKGGEYGLLVKIRPIAGPFRGPWELSPILVRQAIHVDRDSAQVTAISDPFPTIHHGIPLRTRRVTVLVDRGGFMRNPSSCAPKQIDARISSAQGAAVNRARPFRAAGCARLPFRPRLALRLTGPRQVTTGRHPGIRAQVTQRPGEAGIRRAEVRLPRSLALDVDNAQALCEFEDGTKPDLENHCPRGSIVGRARAVSPLLKEPLVGNVYFVKNVRRSSTGNLIRTLPMIIVALRGEISINLRGVSNVKGGKLVNTFADVPDAPVSRFNLNIVGGNRGIIAVTRTRRSLINLCRVGRQIAEADFDGHNNRRHDPNITIGKPCRARRAMLRAARRKAAAKRNKAAANRNTTANQRRANQRRR